MAVPKNLHFIVGPAGTAGSGCKKTESDWLVIQKVALNSYLSKLLEQIMNVHLVQYAVI